MFLAFDELPRVLASATSPVVIVLTTECDEAAIAIHDDVQRALGTRAAVFSMCGELEASPAIVFYEARDDRPILYREGPPALLTVSADLEEAERLARHRPGAEVEAAAQAEAERSTERMLETEDIARFPSAFQMARNLARDAWKAARESAAGAPLLLDAGAAHVRLEVCMACPEFDDGRCRKCGCYMNVKAHLAAMNCPLGKWPGDPGPV
jgi:hypothetical protein